MAGKIAGEVYGAAQSDPILAEGSHHMIERIGPSKFSLTRSQTVIHAGVVSTVAVSNSKQSSLYIQSADALAVVDQNLAAAGTDKSRIIMVTCYIADITKKPEFNRAWDEWVDPANLPLRACVSVALEGLDLVELVVTAAI